MLVNLALFLEGGHDIRSMVASAEFEYAEWDAVEEGTLTLFSWCTSGSQRVVLNTHSDLQLIRWLTVVIGTLQMWTKAWIDNAGLDTCVRFAASIQIF